MRVVLPNDPIPAAFPGLFYWYRAGLTSIIIRKLHVWPRLSIKKMIGAVLRHTCEPGSQNEFVCYDDSILNMIFPIFAHSMGAYLDGVAKSKKIIIQERFKNFKQKMRKMMCELAKLGAARLQLEEGRPRLQTTDGFCTPSQSMMQVRISEKKLRNGKKY